MLSTIMLRSGLQLICIETEMLASMPCWKAAALWLLQHELCLQASDRCQYQPLLSVECSMHTGCSICQGPGPNWC